jgi:two-component system sensor histidine kinase VicK
VIYTQAENTNVLYGIDNVIKSELKFFTNSNKKIDTCMNYTRPPLVITVEPIRSAFIDTKKRDVKLRYLTDITKDNISSCKELLQIVDELRHLDGIKGNFMVSEAEYLAPLVLFEKGKIASQVVYSNVKELVEQQTYVFESFWNKAISAEQRIREIEEGIEPEFFEIIAERKRTSQIFLDMAKSVKKEALFLFPNDKSMVRADRL